MRRRTQKVKATTAIRNHLDGLSRRLHQEGDKPPGIVLDLRSEIDGMNQLFYLWEGEAYRVTVTEVRDFRLRQQIVRHAEWRHPELVNMLK